MRGNCLGSGKTFLGAYKKRKTLFGGTKCYDFKLRINKRIDLPEADIEDIIIHEMIHYHIAYRGIKDTSTHGMVFKMLMNDINKRFGRQVSEGMRSLSLSKCQHKRRRLYKIIPTPQHPRRAVRLVKTIKVATATLKRKLFTYIFRKP